MTLTIELTPEEQAAIEGQAAACGMALPEFVKLRALENVPPAQTWGAQVIEKWKQAGVIGSYGDLSKDSPELARELRGRLETDLFQRPRDAA